MSGRYHVYWNPAKCTIVDSLNGAVVASCWSREVAQIVADALNAREINGGAIQAVELSERKGDGK